MVMMGRRGADLITAVAAALTLFCAFAGATAQEPQKPALPRLPCGGDEIARGTVSRVIDGRTLVLGDGREVRLAAIDVPPLPAAKESGAAPGGDVAKAALAKLLDGAQVVLAQAEFAADRYGRTVAYVDAVRADSRSLAQADLISEGFARVGDSVSDRNCARELFRRENAARKAKLGLWSDPYYDLLPADKPAQILARRGRFTLVEGEVVSVHASGPTIYLNFGQRWSEDFAVTIRKRNERKFATAGLDVEGLTGRRVRVRGWIEARGGLGGSPWRAPWIEAAHPEQIETADRE